MSGPYALPPLTQPPPALAGDDRFLGLNMKYQRWQLPAGYYARGENKRCHSGIVEDRAGTRTPVFANKGLSVPYLGSGVYSNPNGREVCLLGVPLNVAAVRSGTAPQEIPTALDLSGRIEFSQQFDKVLLHSDDPDLALQQWDGLDPAGFKEVVPSKTLGNGVTQIPRCPWSINYLGRAWFILPDEPGWIGASDINDYTVYDSILHKFRINTGTSDGIVGLYPYPSQFGLIVGKERSFDLLGPIPGDLGDSWYAALIIGLSPSSAPPPSMNVIPGPRGVGLRARKCAVFTGSDLLFLSGAGVGGIYRVAQTGRASLAGGLEIDPVPVSEAIEPLMRRINWAAAGGAVAEMDGTFAYFAVPIDGATFNNAVLVLDIVTRQWAGVDLWFSRGVPGRDGRTKPPIPNALRIDNLLGFEFYGRRRIFALSHSEALIRLLYEGREDQLAAADKTGAERRTYPIRGLVETRGYATAGATMKQKMNALHLSLATYAPNVTVTELGEGVQDEEIKQTIAPDRAQYDIEGKAAYNLTNRNDDFLAPKRLDYEIRCGDGFMPGLLPTPVEVEQQSVVELSLSRRNRSVSYRVESNGGNTQLLAVVVESEQAQQEGRKT